MLYHLDTEERTVAAHHVTVYTLSQATTQTKIEVWPSHGFNCLRWQVRGQDLLFTAPDWNDSPIPTRSGIPILFPFPNRIRNGQFSFHGQTYQLPKNDAVHVNAIHGFSPRIPWRVCGYAADQDSAWIHGEFQLSIDATEAGGCWPGDGVLSVIYRLRDQRLTMEMEVRNTGTTPFPFGVGLHPYFVVPGGSDDISRYKLHAPALTVWELENTMPSGRRVPVPDEINFNRPRLVADAKLDTLYGDVSDLGHDERGLLLRATLGHEDRPGTLQIWTSADFRESVLFTPPHRKAICVEPYTCATDAANMADPAAAGWRELPVGGKWQGIVEMRWLADV